MSSDSIQDIHPASVENASSGEVEGESNNVDSLEVGSSSGDATRELQSAAELLTRVELDLACSSEKLVNLDILVMHVASRENDFEAFGSEEEHALECPAERALEFDLLCGFLDSEVRGLESFLSDLQSEIASSRDLILSFKRVGYALKELDEKLQDCEDSLNRSFEQVSDIKTQSANFQRILLASSGDENWRDDEELAGLENGSSSNLNAKIKMQTAEQQREILRMLEKSLAREMDLEKKLSESRQTEDDLKFQLEQEVYCMEEEAEEMFQRLFEAENSTELLSGISNELLARLQIALFSINGSSQRERQLSSKLQELSEQLKEKDRALQLSESSRTELVEKVNSLEQIKKDLEVKAAEAEKGAEIAEAEYKSLRESNMELDIYANYLKGSIADVTERVEQLESQLKESEFKRMHASATAEASQEKQIMLDCTIKDMENIIENLKSKVLKVESEKESVEEECMMVSESNVELIEEINFLRRKMEHLETSLHQADKAKKETAKDISMRTKLMTDLLMQLAVERERLHKQLSSLTKEKEVAVKYLQRMKEPSVTVIGSHDAKVKKVGLSENDSKNGTSRNESNEGIMGSSAISDMISSEHKDSSTAETKTSDVDSTSELDTVRNIDARQLTSKSVLMVVLVLVIPTFAAFLFQQSRAQT